MSKTSSNASQDRHPSENLISLQGADYLPVNQRIAWLVQDRKEGKIGSFEIVTNEIDHRIFHDETRKKDNAESRVKAEITIRDHDGNVIAYASSIGTETMLDFRDYSEKAETKSVGRALAMVGYGTQHSAQDFDEGEKASPITGKVGPAVADAPIRKPQADAKPKTPAKAKANTESVTVDEKAEGERKKEIAKWLAEEKNAGNETPVKLAQKAAAQYKTSSGMDPDASVKLLDLPLKVLEKVYETAVGLSASD